MTSSLQADDLVSGTMTDEDLAATIATLNTDGKEGTKKHIIHPADLNHYMQQQERHGLQVPRTSVTKVTRSLPSSPSNNVPHSSLDVRHAEGDRRLDTSVDWRWGIDTTETSNVIQHDDMLVPSHLDSPDAIACSTLMPLEHQSYSSYAPTSSEQQETFRPEKMDDILSEVAQWSQGRPLCERRQSR